MSAPRSAKTERKQSTRLVDGKVGHRKIRLYQDGPGEWVTPDGAFVFWYNEAERVWVARAPEPTEWDEARWDAEAEDWVPVIEREHLVGSLAAGARVLWNLGVVPDGDGPWER